MEEILKAFLESTTELSAALPATLAGLSFAACTFFYGLTSNKTSDLIKLRQKIEKINKQIDNCSSASDKFELNKEKEIYNVEIESLGYAVENGPIIVRRLMVAYYCFLVAILDKLVLDGPIKEKILENIKNTALLTINQFGNHLTLSITDGMVITVGLGGGLIALTLASTYMFKTVNSKTT